MIRALLFDLDDTLLESNMDRLLADYFKRIAEHATGLLDQKQFLNELLSGTRAMMTSTDTTITNRDAFWTHFQQRTGLDITSTEAHFTQFYENEFPGLQSVTRPRPVAREIISWAFDQRYSVAIATNPVFPRRAIEHRLAWAGIPVDEFEFVLVTSYENCHATKPHAAYYLEILQQLGCQPEEAIMVGDNWENDIVPASQVGLFTYWISRPGTRPPDPDRIAGYGSLEALYERLRAGWLQTLGAEC